MNADSAAHSRAALSARVSKTGWRSNVERPMTLSTSLVAVCCSSDSLTCACAWASARFSEDAELVVHRPPGVREADCEVKGRHDRHGCRIPGDEVQGATTSMTVRRCDVGMLIVHPDPEPEAIPEQKQVPPGSTANIENAHVFGYNLLQEFKLRT